MKEGVKEKLKEREREREHWQPAPFRQRYHVFMLMSVFPPAAGRRKKTDGITCTFSAHTSPEMTLQGGSRSSASSEAVIISSAG